MRRKLLSVCAVLLTGVALALTFAQAVQSSGQEKPAVRSRKGIPIASLVTPGREEIVIEKDQARPHFVLPPPGMGQLEWITTLSPFVLILRVTELTAALTPPQDWITTTVAAEIEAVIKQPKIGAINIGNIINFQQDGGELIIRGVKVHAVLPWATQFEQGHRYLVFADCDSTTDTWIITQATSYRIDSDQRLVSLAQDPTPDASPMKSEHAVPLEIALARVRSAIKPK